MPTKVTLDFETRSECALTGKASVGAWMYSLHPSTEVLCVCFMDDADEFVSWSRGPEFGPNKRTMRTLYDLAADEFVLFEAHYAGFEYAIWHNIMHKRHGFPDIPPERWRDSAAVAAYKAMPRDLGRLGKALDAPHKKSEDGKKIMLKMCKPVHEKFQHLHGKWHQSEEDFKALVKYCIDDVKAEHSCSKILGELPASELQTWLLDFTINQRGLRVDIPFVEAGNKMKVELQAEIAKQSIDAIGIKPSQVQKLKVWMKDRGVVLPLKEDKKTRVKKETLNAVFLKKLVADEFTRDDVKFAARMRQDDSVTSLAKLNAAMNFADPLGIVRGILMYHGATTGRWAGKALQPHNLPRGVFNEETVAQDIIACCAAITRGDITFLENWFGDIGTAMQMLKSCLRGMIIPRDGYILRVMDLSQIEARVLPWLAGQQDVLQAFIDGKDLYKFTAAQIYNVLYEAVTKPQRFIGKTASLALGYQGGPVAFANMALNFGVLIERKDAEKIKKDWRGRNEHIVKFWYDLEKAAIYTIQSGKPTRVHGKIAFRMRGQYLTMVLPSGRRLWYYQPKIKERTIELGEGRKYTKAGISYMGSDSARNIVWGRVHTYGGRLAENATQAASRDILVCGMHNVNDAGYRIVLHVHDEIVTEDKPSHGSLEEIKELMLDLPSWADGLPVDADGFECERYYKG